MKTKKLAYLFVMLCLVILTILTTPAKVAAGCSGDDCGCYDQVPECIAECPPLGDPDHMACAHACTHASVQCAVCCCCSDICPTYC